MKQEFHSIAMLRKKFDAMKPSKKDKNLLENEPKAFSTSNLMQPECDFTDIESLSKEKLIEAIKKLTKENKELKKINQAQAKEIKKMNKLLKDNSDKEEKSLRPQSCLRTNKSVPKKNRVMFSKDLVHIMNESNTNALKISKYKDVSSVYYPDSNKKTVQKIDREPRVYFEDSEYYTPMSSSLQEKKVPGSFIKHYDFSPKVKQKIFTKIHKF
jgi:phage I-like protein